MNIILFEQDEISQPLAARDSRASHIKKVLRKTVGDTFEAGIIDGNEGLATITAIENGSVFLTFTALSPPKPLYPLTLLIGFPRPIQLKRLLRDAASLGVEAIHLMGTQLGEKSYMESSLVERGAARESLLEGIMQAKATCIPKIFMHRSVSECLESLAFFGQKKQNTTCLLLDTKEPVMALSDACRDKRLQNKQVVAAIGSERGWTDRERQLFAQKGFASASLGGRILRTETAAVSATTLILAAMNLL